MVEKQPYRLVSVFERQFMLRDPDPAQSVKAPLGAEFNCAIKTA